MQQNTFRMIEKERNMDGEFLHSPAIKARPV
jgi:hypothetical protein